VIFLLGASDFQAAATGVAKYSQGAGIWDRKNCKRYLCNDHYTPWHG
jgi:hypothetical protein